MTVLTAAHKQLFERTPDECIESLAELERRVTDTRETSKDRWLPPGELLPTSDLTLCLGSDGGEYRANDWSFSQLCRMAGVSKDTLNRLSPKTASRALQETLPQTGKPLQCLVTADLVRSVHGAAYTRLWNAELLETVREAAPGFEPPQRAATEARGSAAGAF